MARIRTIKPDFFRHEGLFEADQQSGLPLRLAFAGLWTAADREGRFKWQPRQLKLDCLPYDDINFGVVLDALVHHGFIVKYSEDSENYGYIPSWNKHQHVNTREAQSSLPSPTDANTFSRTEAHVRARGEQEGVLGREQEWKDGGGDARASIVSIPFADETEALLPHLMRARRLDPDDPRAVGDFHVVNRWLVGGWSAVVIRSVVEIVMAKTFADGREVPQALSYFEKAIARAHAERDRPLPVGTISRSEKTHARRPEKPQDASDVLRRLSEECRDVASG